MAFKKGTKTSSINNVMSFPVLVRLPLSWKYNSNSFDKAFLILLHFCKLFSIHIKTVSNKLI